MVLLVAIRLVYVAPFAIIQDVVAARQVINGEPVPATAIQPLVRQALVSEPPPAMLDSSFPWLARVAPGLAKQEQQEHDDIPSIIQVQAHPPVATMFIVPFVFVLGIYKTSIALALLSLVSLGASLLMIAWGLNLKLSTSQMVLCCSVFLGWYPMFLVIRSGQLGMLLSMLVVAGWYNIQRNRPVLGGVAVGIASSLKLFPALLLVYFLLRHRRACWAAIATIILLNGATLAIVGQHFFVDYMETGRFVVDTYGADLDNWSLLGTLHHIGGIIGAPALASGPVFMAASLLMVAGISLVVLLGRPSSGRTDLEYSMFVVAMVFLSPTCWSHYYVLLLLPLAVIAVYVNKERSLPLLMFVGLLLVLAIPHSYHKVLLPIVEPYFGVRSGMGLVLLPSLAVLLTLLWLVALAWTSLGDRSDQPKEPVKTLHRGAFS
jgi:hypothetical protein